MLDYENKYNGFVIKPGERWSYGSMNGSINEKGEVIIEPKFTECILYTNNGITLAGDEKESISG